MAILPDGHFANIDGQHTSRSIIYSHEQMLPLQFTGLKDKDGKEIYEGDYIKVDTGVTRRVEWREEFAGFMPFVIPEFASYAGSLEVIGNIYENPELLKS